MKIAGKGENYNRNKKTCQRVPLYLGIKQENFG
jgi:hypothetical protein